MICKTSNVHSSTTIHRCAPLPSRKPHAEKIFWGNATSSFPEEQYSILETSFFLLTPTRLYASCANLCNYFTPSGCVLFETCVCTTLARNHSLWLLPNSQKRELESVTNMWQFNTEPEKRANWEKCWREDSPSQVHVCRGGNWSLQTGSRAPSRTGRFQTWRKQRGSFVRLSVIHIPVGQAKARWRQNLKQFCFDVTVCQNSLSASCVQKSLPTPGYDTLGLNWGENENRSRTAKC